MTTGKAAIILLNTVNSICPRTTLSCIVIAPSNAIARLQSLGVMLSCFCVQKGGEQLAAAECSRIWHRALCVSALLIQKVKKQMWAL